MADPFGNTGSEIPPVKKQHTPHEKIFLPKTSQSAVQKLFMFMKRRAVPGSKIRRTIRKRSTFTVFPDASEPIWFRGVFSINVSPPAYHGHDDDRYRTTDFQGKCGTAGADAIRKSPPDWS